MQQRPRFASIFALLMVLSLGAVPASAQIEGVNYTLTPTYNFLRWEKELGLEDTELLGGQLGLHMGSFLSVHGYYLGRNGVQTNLAGLDLLDAGAQPLVDQSAKIRNFGADLILNLGKSSTAPFLKAGGGVLRLTTADGDETDQINVKLGGGLRMGFDRFQAVAYVEDSAVRMDRYDLASNLATDPAFPVDEDAAKIRHNLSAGVGLEFKLGGYRQDKAMSQMDQAILRRYQAGLTGMSLPIEVFAGTVKFDEGLGLDNQGLIGARTGLDFGQFVGLRGYFWQGLKSDNSDTAPVQSYGGEAQFNLNAGAGGVPYLLFGVGQLDFESGYRDRAGMTRDDRTMLILGGGVGFTAGNRFRIDLGIRDYMFSEEDLDNVSGTEQLVHNWGITAGMRFSFGRGGFSFDPAPELPPLTDTAVATGEPVVVAVSPTLEAAAKPAAKPAATPTATATDPQVSAGGEVAAADPSLSPATKPEAVVETDYRGDRKVTIPIPTNGELYVRYGLPGGVEINSTFGEGARPEATAASPRLELDPELIRSILREELQSGALAEGSTTSPAVDAEALRKSLSDEFTQKMDQRFDELAQLVAANRGTRPADPNTIIVRDGSVDAITEAEDDFGWSAKGTESYLGFGIDDPEQFVLGARLDLGPVSRGSRLHFLPELGLGFGSDATSFLVAGNLKYSMRAVQDKGAWSPFLSVGAGVLGYSKAVAERARQEGVLNFSYGVTANLGPATTFVEHQGVDLFDLNRILLGVTWTFGN